MALIQWVNLLGGRFSRLLGTMSGAIDAIVIDRSEKARLLTRLCHERPFITVGMQGSSQTFSSVLMNVSDDGADLWIEMWPPVGRKGQLAPSTKLEIRGQLDGGTLSFRTSVTTHDEREGKLCYRLSGPRILTYQQRRSAPRLRPKKIVYVYIVDPSANLLEGTLSDISVGGLAVNLSESNAANLKLGIILPSCTIRLSASVVVQSAIQIRHLRQLYSPSTFELGAQFLSLPRRHQEKLESFVADLESA